MKIPKYLSLCLSRHVPLVNMWVILTQKGHGRIAQIVDTVSTLSATSAVQHVLERESLERDAVSHEREVFFVSVLAEGCVGLFSLWMKKF